MLACPNLRCQSQHVSLEITRHLRLFEVLKSIYVLFKEVPLNKMISSSKNMHNVIEKRHSKTFRAKLTNTKQIMC